MVREVARFLGRGAWSEGGIWKQGKGRGSLEEARGWRWVHPEYREEFRTGRGLGVPGSWGSSESIGRAWGPGKRFKFWGRSRGHRAGASGG